ncbi:MAG: pyridoxal-phosphate dependent enzyme [Actinomycetota bacterium]
MSAATTLVCAGCGAEAGPDERYPFRCPAAVPGDDVDHVMTVVLDPAGLRLKEGNEPNPFVRYRELFHSYHVARSHGLGDEGYVDLVRDLDERVAAVDGHGFRITPFERSPALSDRLDFSAAGGVRVKDETGNVSGSHKARHLMGLMMHLKVVERLGLARGRATGELAIASCGNAALAAAVVARAAGLSLQVFVPTSADPVVVTKLKELHASLTTCPREEGVAGDPTYHRLQQAIRQGALPFTCQGSDNGLTIEGGKTLGYEIASELQHSGGRLDRLFIQVGGGALASSVIQGLRDAVALGRLPALPRIHTVQTKGAHPLKRAFDRVTDRIRAGSEPEEALRYAATHRSEFMWPWEEEPRSVAHGILDDETYDWLAVVRGMLETGGWPVVVTEEALRKANEAARADTGIDVDHTGSSGLAGLLELHRGGVVSADERVAVLFTGVRR